MSIRKFGTEPAKTEVRAEDNDQETLASMKAQASFESSEVATQADEFLSRPETGEARRRRP